MSRFYPTKAEGVVVILFFYLALSAAAITWNFVGPWVAHSASAVLIVAAILKATMTKIPRVALTASAAGLVVLAYSFCLLDTQDVLLAGSWWAVCSSYFILFHRQEIRSRVIVSIAIIVHVLFLLWAAFGLREADPGVPFNKLTLIPVAENGYIINIGMPGSTKHFTATLAGMLLLWGIHRFLEGGAKPLHIAITGWAAYLTIFSASRAVYLGVAFALAAMILNRRKPRMLASMLLLGVGVWACYGLPLVVGAVRPVLPGTIGVLLKTVEDNPDVTAGRAWLWDYHLRVFSENLLGGGRAALVDLQTDVALGLARGSSESFFTGLLAIYGLAAIAFFLVYIAGYVKALLNRDVEVAGLMMFVIITTATSSLFSDVYGPFSAVMLALVASRWNRHELRLGRKRYPRRARCSRVEAGQLHGALTSQSLPVANGR